jgi:hypothetical protein
MCEERCAYTILVGKPEGRRTLGRTRPNGWIILQWIFKKWEWSMDWIDLAENVDR